MHELGQDDNFKMQFFQKNVNEIFAKNSDLIFKKFFAKICVKCFL